MIKNLTIKQGLQQFNTSCRIESFKHPGYKIKTDSGKDSSFCEISEYGNIDIDIGTKYLHSADFFTDDSFVQLYANLYHELGHANTYIGIRRKQVGIDKMPFTDTEKHILLDRAIGAYIPEYTAAIYLNNYDEKLAEINSLSHIQKMADNRHSIFNKLGIDAEKIWLNHIKNNAWYSPNRTAISKASSLQDCIDLLQSEISTGSLSIPMKLNDAKEFVSDVVKNPQLSLLPEIQRKPELMTYIDKASNKNELEQRILDSINTVSPNLIDNSLKQILPSCIKYPRKLSIQSNREIKNRPDFINDNEINVPDYTPP